MEIKNKFPYWKRFFLLLIALFIMALGGSLFLKSGIGGDSVLVFNQGFANLLNVSIGLATIIFSLSFFIIVLLVDYRKIGIGSAVVVFLLGPLIDGFTYLIRFISPPDHLFFQIVLSIVACIVAGFGIGLYLFADCGLSPVDALFMIVVNKTKWKLKYVKIGFDLILFIIGVLLGGVFGIGSIVSVFLMGPILEYSMNLYRKVIK